MLDATWQHMLAAMQQASACVSVTRSRAAGLCVCVCLCVTRRHAAGYRHSARHCCAGIPHECLRQLHASVRPCAAGTPRRLSLPSSLPLSTTLVSLSPSCSWYAASLCFLPLRLSFPTLPTLPLSKVILYSVSLSLRLSVSLSISPSRWGPAIGLSHPCAEHACQRRARPAQEQGKAGQLAWCVPVFVCVCVRACVVVWCGKGARAEPCNAAKRDLLLTHTHTHTHTHTGATAADTQRDHGEDVALVGI